MNELYAAYQVSQQTYDYHAAPEGEIDRLLRCGWVVVLEEHPAYCPITDAQLPGRDRYIRGFRSRAEAVQYARETVDATDGRATVI